VSEKVAQEKILHGAGRKLKDILVLLKFRLSLTVVFSSLMAYLISSPQQINWQALPILALGGFFVTGAANALNQALEKDFDKLMKRTANRPLAAGRMKMSEAILIAGFLSLGGISLLALFNPWTAFLGTLALVVYSFIYTPIKRVSPIAIVVGAIPGALPVMIGSVAAAGELTVLALVLFVIQFLWQFPHFSSIGFLGYADYAKAGFKLIPEKSGQPDKSIGIQSLVYSFLLIPAVVLPFIIGVTGIVSLIVVVLVSIGYFLFSVRFFRIWNKKSALLLMFFSIAYIPIVTILLFADKV